MKISNRILYLILLILFFLISCKTIVVKNRETEAKVMFKNLMKESEQIDKVFFSGSFKITGVKEIPPTYISFQSEGSLKEKIASFSISLFKKPIIDIFFEQDKVFLLNHTKKQFIKFKVEEIDYSKIMGINFNPIEICYFFLGKIPYSSDMQLMEFNWTKKEYILKLTNNISQYEVYLNSDQEIMRALINNQFFDKIILESIKYNKNDDNKNVPNFLNFSSEDGKYKLSFIIEKISLKIDKINSFDNELILDWIEVFKIEDIEIKLK